MFELTHPVALRDEELDLVAAGGGSAPPPKHCGCGGDNDIALVNVETGNINVLNNIAVLSKANQGVFN